LVGYRESWPADRRSWLFDFSVFSALPLSDAYASTALGVLPVRTLAAPQPAALRACVASALRAAKSSFVRLRWAYDMRRSSEPPLEQTCPLPYARVLGVADLLQEPTLRVPIEIEAHDERRHLIEHVRGGDNWHGHRDLRGRACRRAGWLGDRRVDRVRAARAVEVRCGERGRAGGEGLRRRGAVAPRQREVVGVLSVRVGEAAVDRDIGSGDTRVKHEGARDGVVRGHHQERVLGTDAVVAVGDRDDHVVCA